MEDQDKTEQICSAIRNHRLISIYYDGEYRRVEPHICGHTKTGKLMLRAYQVEGYSESGENYFWKMFDIEKIEQVNVLEERFLRPRNDYNPIDPVIHEPLCKL